MQVNLYRMEQVKMDIQLLTDSSSDIPDYLKDKYEIEIVASYVHFGDEQFQPGIDIDQQTFLEKMRNEDAFPRSSAPNPGDFLTAYEKLDPEKPILVLPLSSGISSTYQHAEMAKQMLLEKHPKRRIEVIDSKTASPGLILLLNEAGKKVTEGWPFEEIVEHMRRKVENTTTLFILKTLENVIRGGRLDRVRGAIAGKLNIKLILKASSEGTIEVVEKVRGDKKSVSRFIDQIGRHSNYFENRAITMTHCNAEERAKEVMDKIKQKYPFKQVLVEDMGPLISTYAGEGALVIAFFND